MEIPDQLQCLFSSTVREQDGTYVVELPEQEVRVGNLQPGATYRVALLPTSTTGTESDAAADTGREHASQRPPVSEGDQRTVEIEDIGDQGDGITRVERGFVVIVPETDPGERVEIEITDVRDGIYYSWASDVEATGNTLWDLRYGVHYMYSDDNRIADNVAFENDVGYALMVSDSIEVVNNTAVANRGQSGHGILLKEIDRSVVRGNDLVANDDGIFLYNAQHNDVRGNLLYATGAGARRGRPSPATGSSRTRSRC